MKQEIRKAVMAVIVNIENKVLIGSSPRDGGFKFPQGGLDENEHFVDGIIRELNVELDLDITINDISQSYTETVKYIYPNEDKYIFKSQELNIVKVTFNDQMKLIPQDDEFEELIWINPSELPNYNTYFRAQAYEKALVICGLL